MTTHRIQQGELAYWLRVVAANNEPDAAQTEVPEHFIHALTTLRCVELAEDGRVVITDKGRLALRMEEPGARALY